MKNLTNLDLSELICMQSELINTLHKFNHLSDSKEWKTIDAKIQSDFKRSQNEYDKRQDNF